MTKAEFNYLAASIKAHPVVLKTAEAILVNRVPFRDACRAFGIKHHRAAIVRTVIQQILGESL